MIKDQLENIRNSRKTILRKKTSTVGFVSDEIDTEELLKMITIDTPYTQYKSLSFDRHQLSEREEMKFNSKFAPFLKGLLTEMRNESIKYMLEFLVRIYSIDSYNESEMVYLLTPFPQFTPQLILVTNQNVYLGMVQHSTDIIARSFIKDYKLFNHLVSYYKHYDYLNEFLTTLLGSLRELLKTTNNDYLTVFYKILQNLISDGKKEVAFDIYNKLKFYLDSDEFVALFANEIVLEQIEIAPITKLQGREVLQNIEGLKSAVKEQRLDTNVFTNDEIELLEHVYNNKLQFTLKQDISVYLNLYRQIVYKLELTKVLVENEQIFPYMKEDDLIYYLNHVSEINLNILNNNNLIFVLNNIPTDYFKNNYDAIITKAMYFTAFQPALFDKFVFIKNDRTELVEMNMVKLANYLKYDLTKQLTKNDYKSPVFLKYAIVNEGDINKNYHKYKNIVVSMKNGDVVMTLADCLNKSGSKINIIDFIDWAAGNGFYNQTVALVESHTSFIDKHHRENYFIKCSAVKLLTNIDPSFIAKVYDSENWQEPIKTLANERGYGFVLINHPRCYEYLQNMEQREFRENFDKFAPFLLTNIATRGALVIIIKYSDLIVLLRRSTHWDLLKTVIFESEKNVGLPEFCIENAELFNEHDYDLFEHYLSYVMDMEQLKRLRCESMGSATILDAAIHTTNNLDELLPLLPLMAKNLIKYKRASVEILFEKYGDLMSLYCTDLLEHSIERADLLIYANIKQSVKAILKIKKYELLKMVLEKHETDSLPLVNLISDEILNNSVEFGVIYEFIGFYTRSFADEYNENVAAVNKKVLLEYPELYNQIFKEYLDTNHAIFEDCYIIVESDVLTGKLDNLEFYGEFIKYLDNEQFDDVLDVIVLSNNPHLPMVLSNICNCNQEYTEKVIDKLTHVTNDSDESIVSRITIFGAFIQSVPNANLSKIKAVVGKFIEHKNKEIASLAERTYETIQFEN